MAGAVEGAQEVPLAIEGEGAKESDGVKASLYLNRIAIGNIARGNSVISIGA